jgi:hypothetical protein
VPPLLGKKLPQILRFFKIGRAQLYDGSSIVPPHFKNPVSAPVLLLQQPTLVTHASTQPTSLLQPPYPHPPWKDGYPNHKMGGGTGPLPKKTKKVMININSTGDENNNECKSLKGGSYDLEQAGPGLCAITAMIAERGKVLSNSE